MICFGTVIIEPALNRTFYGKLKPISEKWIPEALKVSGFSCEDVLKFPDPEEVMMQFDDWLKENVTDRPMFISDNNGSIGSSSIGTSITSWGEIPLGSARRTWALCIKAW